MPADAGMYGASESSSHDRLEDIEHKVSKTQKMVKHLYDDNEMKEHEEHEMKEHVNVFAGQGGYGNCGVDGFGSNALLFALLAGRGFGGLGGYGYGADGVGLVDTAVDIQTLTKLGDVQGQIGLSAAQTQNSLLEQTIANQQAFANVSAGICAVNSSVKDAAYAVSTAVSNDGEKTRALIQAQYNADQAQKVADLERQLGVSQASNNTTAQLYAFKQEIAGIVNCAIAQACHSGNGNGPKS